MRSWVSAHSATAMNALVRRFRRKEKGLTTVEYAIAGGLVGAAVVLSFVALGDAVWVVIDYLKDLIETPPPAS